MDFESSLYSILETSEIKYLNDNNYKYDEGVDNILFCDMAKLYVFLVEKNNEKYCFVKFDLIDKSEFFVKIISNNKFVLNKENDFCSIGILNENNAIEFQIEYNNIINNYSMQFNE